MKTLYSYQVFVTFFLLVRGEKPQDINVGDHENGTVPLPFQFSTVPMTAVTLPEDAIDPPHNLYDKIHRTNEPMNEIIQYDEEISYPKDFHRVAFSITNETAQSLPLTEDFARIKTCDRTFHDLQFTIQHPSFPESYDDKVQCQYVITRYSEEICGVEMTFLRFSLEMSPACKNDYLAIGDERLCGQIGEDSIVEYPFEDDVEEILIIFKTNENVTDDGFQIRMRQLSQCDNDLNAIPAVHACDVLITDVSGELVTHRTPESKEPACRYTIGRRHSGFCQVELDFIDFNVDYKPGCASSYVQLDGHRFCGTALRNQRKNITFDPLGNVQLIYRTDTIRSDRGFHLLFRQIPCPPFGHPIRSPGGSDLISNRDPHNCNKVFYEKEFYLESPGFPNTYFNNLDCNIAIRKFRGSVCRIDVRFLDFDVESSPGCQYDYLQLDSERLCGRIPEDNVRTLSFDGYEKLIRFKSDYVNTRPGFFLYVRQLDCFGGVPTPTLPGGCDSVIRTVEGRINSPNYPDDYGNNAYCRYTIHRYGEHICQLKVKFMDFQLEDGGAGCFRDYLKLDDWSLCGESIAGTSRTVPFVTPTKVLVFASDPFSTRRGFSIVVKQIPCGQSEGGYTCDREYESPSFEIRSENYPSIYPAGLHCRYVLRRTSSSICQLRIRFVVFELEPSISCSRDYLSVDGEKLCGILPNNTTRTLPFDTLDKILVFHTDEQGEAPGFLARIEQLECDSDRPSRSPGAGTSTSSPFPPSLIPPQVPPPPGPGGGCDYHFLENQGSISSPNYPLQYPNDITCTYAIHLAPGYCQVDLTFTHFALEQPYAGTRCLSDYMEISGSRYCGQQLHGVTRREPLFGVTRKLVMLFFTNSRISDKGFLISYRQVPCSGDLIPPSIPPTGSQAPVPATVGDPVCSQNHGTALFDVFAPALGSADYGQTLHCVHKVWRLGSETCGLRVTFVEFDLGDGIDCPRQYLQIGDFVHCGSLTPYTIRDYAFQGYSMVIRLTSSKRPRPRMHLRVEQTPCDPLRPPPPVAPTCDEHLFGNVFEIRSPYYLLGYDGRLDCRYIVRRTSISVCRLELTFERFSLPSSHQCRLSHFRVDADTLCGSLVPFTVRVYDFAASEKLIHFQAEQIVPGTGFVVRGRQIPCTTAALEVSPDVPGNSRTTELPTATAPSSIRCDQTFGLTEFTIFSPNHPEWYPPSVLCRYVILRAASDVCGLEVTFLNFDLEDYYHCQRDYLDIDGERLCGLLPALSKRHYNFHPADRTKVLVFHSDFAVSRPGFALRIRQTNDCRPHRESLLTPSSDGVTGEQRERSTQTSDGCEPSFFSAAAGEIRSPRYGASMYPGPRHCVFTFIQRSRSCGVSLRFKDFDLFPSTDCMQDYVTIESRRYCHQQLLQMTREIFFPWNESSTISVTFHSEADRFSNRGFSADFEQLPCPGNRQGRRWEDADQPENTNTTSSTALNWSETDVGNENWDENRGNSLPSLNSTTITSSR